MRIVVWLALIAGFVHPTVGLAGTFIDPLNQPARFVARPASAHLNAITSTGERLIAVGARGLIIVSSDSGASWNQVESPVSSDLLAVHFPSISKGWIVGHDGVVLHSADGGMHWTRQFDGRQAAALLRNHFQKLIREGDTLAEQLMPEIELNYQNGPEQALLDVWFIDDQSGFVVGSFGTIFSTHDGGQSWQSWVERVEIDRLLHYNAILGLGDEVFIASEEGLIFRMDSVGNRFVPIETGYDGSFFALAGEATNLVAFGLRGAAYRSTDSGKTWVETETGVNGSFSAAVWLDSGSLIATTRNGQTISSRDGGRSFTPVIAGQFGMLMGFAEVSTGLTGAGPRGIFSITQ